MTPTGSTSCLGIRDGKASGGGPHSPPFPRAGSEGAANTARSAKAIGAPPPLLRAGAHLPPSPPPPPCEELQLRPLPPTPLARPVPVFAPALSRHSLVIKCGVYVKAKPLASPSQLKKAYSFTFHVVAGTASRDQCCVESAVPGLKGELGKEKKSLGPLSSTDLFRFILVLKPANFQTEGWGIVLLELLDRPSGLFLVESGVLNVQAPLGREDLGGAG